MDILTVSLFLLIHYLVFSIMYTGFTNSSSNTPPCCNSSSGSSGSSGDGGAFAKGFQLGTKDKNSSTSTSTTHVIPDTSSCHHLYQLPMGDAGQTIVTVKPRNKKFVPYSNILVQDQQSHDTNTVPPS